MENIFTFFSGDIEENAISALSNYLSDPDIDSVACFPDIHFCSEKALPVGVAFSTKDYVYPLITGKDMGCGVSYLKIDKKFVNEFDKKHYKAFDRESQRMTDEGLGGGNHFLSLEESDDNFYILVHTGSRNLGIQMFQENRELVNKYDGEKIPVSKLPNDWWDNYNRVLDYAKNRRLEFLEKSFDFLVKNKYISQNVSYETDDTGHNFIEMDGDTIIHRKGSTSLYKDRLAVIPLSMTRGSLIVKPNTYHPDYLNSLKSCSHGAGRRLSRTDTLKYWHNLKRSIKDQYKKIHHELLVNGDFESSILQEFDFAYKSSETILKDQPWLIKVDETKPIITIKFNI